MILVRLPHDWLLLLLLGSGLIRRLHPIHGRLKLLRIANAIRENSADIEGSAAEIAGSLGQRWTSGRARCRYRLGKLNDVHAASCQRLMRTLHQPQPIAPVCNVAGGEGGPSSALPA